MKRRGVAPGTQKEFDPFKGDVVLAANVELLIQWFLGDGDWNPRDDGVPIVGAHVLDDSMAFVTHDDGWRGDEAKPVRALLATGKDEALAHVIMRSGSVPLSGDDRRAQVLHVSLDAQLPDDELTAILLDVMAETGSRLVVRKRPTLDYYQALLWADMAVAS